MGCDISTVEMVPVFHATPVKIETAKLVLSAQKNEGTQISGIISKLDNKYIEQHKGTLEIKRDGLSIIGHSDGVFMDILDKAGLYKESVAQIYEQTEEAYKNKVFDKVWLAIKKKLDYSPVHPYDARTYIVLRWTSVLIEKKMKEIVKNKGSVLKHEEFHNINKKVKEKMAISMERIKI